MYKMGLEKEARPAERLMRKFGEFERRKDARVQDAAEPTSPALPVVRKALVAKLDPFAAVSPPAEQQSARSTAPKKSKSSKMAIFSDSEESSRPDSGSSSKGWDNIGTLAERKKENTIEAKPWVGEKLQSGQDERRDAEADGIQGRGKLRCSSLSDCRPTNIFTNAGLNIGLYAVIFQANLILHVTQAHADAHYRVVLMINRLS